MSTKRRPSARGQVGLLQPTPNQSVEEKARRRAKAKRAKQARKRNR